MIQLKKTLLTLVALLALTTHAWAEETLLVTIYASDDFKSGSKTFDNKVTATFSGEVYFMATKGWCGLSTDDKTLTVEPVDGVTITRVKFYTTLGNDEVIKAPFEASMNSSVVNISGNPRDRYHVSVNGSMIGAEDTHNYLQMIEVYGSSASGPEVAWDKATKTGSFTMPGGNVTLEPEYYPQAALTAAPSAINDVPATTDGAIVSAGTVANIGETTNAQGTVMYYVSPTALDDAALQALAADQWTADVPTAADLAQGQAYVYYYVRGNDSDNDAENFSDGDILATNALTVTIAAEPTYAVTFAEGVNPEPPAEPEWTASPNAGVTKGTPVTVTYTGSKKVIGVKAEKKASTPSLNITSPVVGQVIGSDGKNYAAANVPSGVDKVAMIAYVSGSNGLAIALADEGLLNWATAKSTCEAKTPAFTNGTWKLPSQDEWKQMFIANGGNEDSYDGLNTAITTAGGTAFQDGTVDYWSSSENDSDKANLAQFYYGYPLWFSDWKVNEQCVRACLAF